MDPFALQDEARRNTGRLVALAVLAVAAVVAAAAFVFACGAWTLFRFLIEEKELAFWPFVLNPSVIAWSLFVSFLVVLIGFLVKSDDLSSPEKLMARIGAKQVVRSRTKGSDAKSLARLRLFNVCEEMSIASGVPMPSVWVLEDSGDVNAFVAGTTCDAASLCVTAGALRFLERDELQGVVAHEYSHILNGDMRLNFRLLLLVAGVTAFNSLGGGMLGMFGSHSDADESGRPNTRIRIPSGGKGGKGSGGVAIIILVYLATALLLWLIGSIGVFFARLVQCAVSRQREFLADASAAQFTRNPEALANALRLTYLAGMGRRGSAFDAWRDAVAHVLFTAGERTLFATHPSVQARIARLSPRGIFADEELKARVKRIRAERKAASAARERARAEDVPDIPPQNATAFVARERVKVKDAPVLGNPESRVEALPKEFLARLREPGGAGTALVQLLRGKVPEGLAAMPSRAEKRRIAARCTIAIRDVESEPARRKWADTLTAIAQEDGQIDSFEFMLLAGARRHLAPPREVRTVPAARLVAPASRVLATVASFGSDPEGGYRAAEPNLSLIPTPLPPMPPPYDDAMDFLGALSSLGAMPPLAKREFLFALKAVVAQDGRVTDEESDYVAAAAAAIGAVGW